MINKVLRWWRNWKFDRLVARSPLGTPQALARQAQTPPEVKARFEQGMHWDDELGPLSPGEAQIQDLLREEGRRLRENPPDEEEGGEFLRKLDARLRERYVQTGEKPPGPIDVSPADGDT